MLVGHNECDGTGRQLPGAGIPNAHPSHLHCVNKKRGPLSASTNRILPFVYAAADAIDAQMKTCATELAACTDTA